MRSPALNRRGRRRALRGGAAPGIDDLYGTGMGRVPLHYNPKTAVLDAGNVTAVPNGGGAGATFAGTAPQSGILIDGGLFSLPAYYSTSSGGLHIANAANLVGTRVFFVGNADPALGHAPRIAGSPTGEHNTHIRVAFNGVFTLNRAAESVTVGASGFSFGSLHLYEVEIVGGQARVFVNTQKMGADVACAWPDFFINRIFIGQTHGFQGLAGNIASMVVDGTGGQDAQIARVRAWLKAEHPSLVYP